MTGKSDKGWDLGGYLREQREHARLSVRQLANLAGVSNPYLSQIERGLRNPSAEVLQQIARGLRISAEALYVRAGILDTEGRPDVEAAVNADPELNDRQRRVLLDIYASFRAENHRAAEPEGPEPVPSRRPVARVRSAAAKTAKSATRSATGRATRSAARTAAAAARTAAAAAPSAAAAAPSATPGPVSVPAPSTTDGPARASAAARANGRAPRKRATKRAAKRTTTLSTSTKAARTAAAAGSDTTASSLHAAPDAHL